jgi:hypothetical protein
MMVSAAMKAAAGPINLSNSQAPASFEKMDALREKAAKIIEKISFSRMEKLQ